MNIYPFKNCVPFSILCDVIVIVDVSKENEDGDSVFPLLQNNFPRIIGVSFAADCVSVNIGEFCELIISSISSKDLGAKEFNPPTIKE